MKVSYANRVDELFNSAPQDTHALVIAPKREVRGIYLDCLLLFNFRNFIMTSKNRKYSSFRLFLQDRSKSVDFFPDSLFIPAFAGLRYNQIYFSSERIGAQEIERYLNLDNNGFIYDLSSEEYVVDFASL